MNPNAVFLIPAALRDAANAMMEQLGRGPDNLSIPLASADDFGTVTHYAASCPIGPDFRSILENPPAEAADLMAALILDINEASDDPERVIHADSRSHALAVFAANGLVVAG